MPSHYREWLRPNGYGATEVGTRNISTSIDRPVPRSEFRLPRFVGPSSSPAPRIQRLIRILPRLREHADLNRADGFLEVRLRMHVDIFEQVQIHAIQALGDHDR